MMIIIKNCDIDIDDVKSITFFVIQYLQYNLTTMIMMMMNFSMYNPTKKYFCSLFIYFIFAYLN